MNSVLTNSEISAKTLTHSTDLGQETTVTIEASSVYQLMHDEAGNIGLQPINETSIKAIQENNEKEFRAKMQTLQSNPEFQKIQVSDKGEITHDLDGNAIHSPEKRKEVLAKIKEKLQTEFNSQDNHMFAKMEAVNNFVDNTDYAVFSLDKDGNKIYNYKFETVVNGVKFTMGNTSGDFEHVLKTTGASWQVLSNAANKTDVASMAITSMPSSYPQVRSFQTIAMEWS